LKAVILAGGRGTRLKPMTETVPKPLAILGDKPIIFHILDQIKNQGITEVIITLGYLGAKIEEKVREYKTDLQISFSYENEPLGTAGAVKNALKSFEKADEDFFVLSGDAYCEFDLNKALDFHKKNNSSATLICTRVSDPREFGLVVSDKSGRITRFIEKPGWSQAVTDLANTGTYILNGKALSLIPDNREFDFSKNLFPLIKNKNLPLYSFEEKGYWCDIGDLESYLKCNGYVLKKTRKNDSVPRGNFTISDCVYIGNNVKIGNGVKIGKGTVICDNVEIENNAEITGSVIFENVKIGEKCKIENSVICSDVVIKNDTRIYPNCCVGAFASVGSECVIEPDVNIGCNVKIKDGIKIRRSVFSSVESDCSDYLTSNVDCFTALELGCALGTALKGGKIAVATDSNQKSKAILYAFVSGLELTGTQVWYFGDAFSAQVSFFTYFCSLPIGAFIKTEKERVNISLSSLGGLPLLREFERETRSVLKRRSYSFSPADKVKHPVEMQSVNSIYSSVLFRQSESSLSKIKVKIDTDNEKISILLEDCIRRLEGEVGEGITLHINNDGTEIFVTENNTDYSFENLMSVLVYYETKLGREVSLDYFSPPVYSSVSSLNNKILFRYFSSCADKADLEARQKATGQLWTRDALFMAVRLLSLMHEENCSLSSLMRDVPSFYLSKGETDIGYSPTRLFDIFSDMESLSVENEGVSFVKNNSKAIVLPSSDGKKIKVLTESFDTEASKDLYDEIIEKINSFNRSGNT